MIPGFDGDIPIHATLISAHDPGIKSYEGPSAGSCANASRTQACKRTVQMDLGPLKKAKKTGGKPSGGIKITSSKQKAPA
jgi:hypothetical protein